MKPTKLNYQHEISGIRTLRIVNEMAPLGIESHEESIIEIQAKIPVEEEALSSPDELFVFEQDEDMLELHLVRIPMMLSGMWSNQVPKVNLKIPSGIHLEIETEHMPVSITGMEGGIDIETENGPVAISNCEGSLDLESENAPIMLRNLSGNIKVEIENAPISADAIQGDSLEVESENGPIKIRGASFPKVYIESENGAVHFETLPLEEGEFEIETENGNIHLVLPLGFDFELDAMLETATLKSSIDAHWSVEEGIHRLTRGEDGVKIHLKTENGMIKLSPDGHINLAFLRQKLDVLKESIQKTKTLQDKEEVQKNLGKVIDYVSQLTHNINEEKIKTAISAALEKLKTSVASFDVNETKEKVSAGVEDFTHEVSQTLSSFWEKVRGKVGQEFQSTNVRRHFHNIQSEMRSVSDQINKALKGAGMPGWMKTDMDDDEREQMQDRSRLKILEMLESGKITAEEAERLLRAIGKE